MPYLNDIRDVDRELTKFNNTVIHTDQVGKRLSESSRNTAMGFLYLSQAIEDAQYGFRAVLNNIPGIVMMMGGGPGLAGAVSMAAVATALLADHWDGLAKSFGFGAVETEIQRMERLAKATERTTSETAELQRFQRRTAVTEKIGGPSDTESATIASAIDSIRNTQGGLADIVERLTQQAIEQGRLPSFMDETHLEQLRNAPRTGASPQMVERMRNAIEADAVNTAREMFKRMVESLVAGGERTADQLEALVRRVNPDLARSLGPDARAEALHRAELIEAAKARPDMRRGIGGDGAAITPRGLEDIASRADARRRQLEDEVLRIPEERRERYRAMGDRRAAREDAMYGADASTYAANRMMELVNDPRFRRRVGAGTRAEALDEAQQVAASDLAKQAIMMGATPEQATAFAGRATGRVIGGVGDAIAQSMQELPATNKELAATMKQLLAVQRQTLRSGIPVVWSK